MRAGISTPGAMVTVGARVAAATVIIGSMATARESVFLNFMQETSVGRSVGRGLDAAKDGWLWLHGRCDELMTVKGIILGSTKREEHPQLLGQGPPRGTPLFVDPSSFGRIKRRSRTKTLWPDSRREGRTRQQHAAAAAAGC